MAAVTYHLLTGRPAFDDRTAVSVLHRGATAQPPLLAAEVGPTALDQLLRRSLSWDPELRPPTAADFGRELAQHIGTAASPPAAVPVVRPSRQLPVALVIVLCLVLGTAVFLLSYLLLR